MASFPLSGCRSRVAAITAVSLSMVTIGAPIAAQSEPLSPRITDVTAAFTRQSLDGIIAEASQRFAVPEHWIRAVMQAESAGDRYAVSEAGAMGLMQIMPDTWAGLHAAHGFGDDPFDPRDNVLAGAAYLRAMYDRFGAPGFLAAYNAGPGRHAEHLATGRPLPLETRAYLAALAPLIDSADADRRRRDGITIVTDWRAAPLFVVQIERSVDNDSPSTVDPSIASSDPIESDDRPHTPDPSNELFVRSEPERSP